MNLIKLFSIYIIIALGLSSCSKESIITVEEEIPTIEPTIINGDQTFQLGSLTNRADSVKIFSFFSLGMLVDTFSIDLFTDGHNSMKIDFIAPDLISGVLEEGNQSIDNVFGYTSDYILALEQWNANGASPSLRPVFDSTIHITEYGSENAELNISDIELGDETFQSILFDTDGNPFIDPNTGQPMTIDYKKDICWIGLSGMVLVPNKGNVEISGFFEATYFRIL